MHYHIPCKLLMAECDAPGAPRGRAGQAQRAPPGRRRVARRAAARGRLWRGRRCGRRGGGAARAAWWASVSPKHCTDGPACQSGAFVAHLHRACADAAADARNRLCYSFQITCTALCCIIQPPPAACSSAFPKNGLRPPACASISSASSNLVRVRRGCGAASRRGGGGGGSGRCLADRVAAGGGVAAGRQVWRADRGGRAAEGAHPGAPRLRWAQCAH